MAANPDVHAEQIAAWIEDLADRAAAAEAIAALGEAAVPGLRDYFRRGPEVIPQPRCFAVAMLARLHGEAATSALRAVLRDNRLRGLTPQLAESEYVVKSAAMEALVARGDPSLPDDVAFGIRERLRPAVVAAARLRQDGVAEALAGLLDDDVLADTAVESLIAIGTPAVAAITARLDAWRLEGESSARRRLATIRALRVLYRVAGEDSPATRRALDDPHPAVRAAAALPAWPRRRDFPILDALLHGACGFDRELADDCRAALEHAGAESIEPVRDALRRDAEPDLYGQSQRLSSAQQDWLTKHLRRRQRNAGG
jgi:hypothetical protein